MVPIIKTEPKCELCKAELVVNAVYIDNVHCSYILDCECIICQEQKIIVLALTDFIEINQILNGGKNGAN